MNDTPSALSGIANLHALLRCDLWRLLHQRDEALHFADNTLRWLESLQDPSAVSFWDQVSLIRHREPSAEMKDQVDAEMARYRVLQEGAVPA
jgi:RecB family exonuclease